MSHDSDNFPLSGNTSSHQTDGKATSRRTCILVLGMHRSGTSAFTRAISMMGASLPRIIMPAAEANNELGFWESQRIVDLNDQLLSELGSSWNDWRLFELRNLAADRMLYYKGRIEEIIKEEYGEADNIVLKDPRISRLLPMYKDVLSSCGYDICAVVMNRNPLSVSQSIAKRDGFSPAFASLLWLCYQLEAERNTRGMARAFVSYEDVMEYSASVITTIYEKLPVQWPRPLPEILGDAKASFQRSQQHQMHSESDLANTEWLSEHVRSAYQLLRSLEKDGDGNISVELDRLMDELRSTSTLAGNAFFWEMHSRDEKIKRDLVIIEHKTRDLIVQSQQIDALEKEIGEIRAERRAEIDSIHNQYRSSVSWRMTFPVRVLLELMRSTLGRR